MAGPDKAPNGSRRQLDAWKGIAQYLNRDVTTVRRWERREGLPVHRHLHTTLGSVFAYTDEIDEWCRRRSSSHQPETAVAAPLPPPVNPPPSPRAWREAIGLIAVVGLTVVLALSPTLRRVDAGPEPPYRFGVTPPLGVVIESLVISPEGLRVAFAGRDAEGTRIWVRELDSTRSDALPGTNGATFPFWSFDGLSLGFFANGRLKTISVATREIRDLAAAPNGLGGAWNERGEIVFAPDRGAGIARTTATGGDGMPVTTVTPSFISGHGWPEFLPGGRRFLYTDYTRRPGQWGIYVHDLDSGTDKLVLPAFSSASYAPGGWLLYAQGSLMAQRFDLESLEVRGKPTSIAPRVLQFGDLQYRADFSVSRDGRIVARTADEERNKLVWVDRASGRVTGAIGQTGYNSNPTLSPNGKTLAATVHEDQPYRDRIWLYDVATGEGRSLTQGTSSDFAPLWWPDSGGLFFVSNRDRRSAIFERRLQSDTDSPAPFVPPAYTLTSSTRDGRFVTFDRINATTNFDVWAWQRGDVSSVFPVLTSPANETQSQLSPDGRMLAYASDESGRFEVYVRSFPESSPPWRVSTGGGNDPRWSPDGRSLHFVAYDRQMMVAPVTVKPSIRTGPVRALFDTGLEMLWQDTRNHYDITPDGRRFILLTPETNRREASFTLILEWQRMLGGWVR